MKAVLLGIVLGFLYTGVIIHYKIIPEGLALLFIGLCIIFYFDDSERE